MNIAVLDIKEMSTNGTQVISLSHLRRIDVVGTKNIDWRRNISEKLNLGQPCKATDLKTKCLLLFPVCDESIFSFCYDKENVLSSH